TAEADLSAGVPEVLVVDGGPPQVETAADVVLAPRQRDVRLKRVDPVRAWTEAAGEVLELIDVDAGEESADRRRGELRHEARGPDLRLVEAERGIGPAALEIVRVAAAEVEDRSGADDVHPVADQRAVRADQRELTVLYGTGPDCGGVAHLVARVLTPAEERSILRPEVVVDLADPVPEDDLVEVFRVGQVLLPRRHARLRRVRQRV